jgi:hypothetical protein
MEACMNDLVAEGLLLFSAFSVIVIMVLIIMKERRKRKAIETKMAKNHGKKTIHSRSEGLYIN